MDKMSADAINLAISEITSPAARRRLAATCTTLRDLLRPNLEASRWIKDLLPGILVETAATNSLIWRRDYRVRPPDVQFCLTAPTPINTYVRHAAYYNAVVSA